MTYNFFISFIVLYISFSFLPKSLKIPHSLRFLLVFLLSIFLSVQQKQSALVEPSASIFILFFMKSLIFVFLIYAIDAILHFFLECLDLAFLSTQAASMGGVGLGKLEQENEQDLYSLNGAILLFVYASLLIKINVYEKIIFYIISSKEDFNSQQITLSRVFEFFLNSLKDICFYLFPYFLSLMSLYVILEILFGVFSRYNSSFKPSSLDLQLIKILLLLVFCFQLPNFLNRLTDLLAKGLF